MITKDLDKWEEFVSEVHELRDFRERKIIEHSPIAVASIFFRGQANSEWSLSTTLERAENPPLDWKDYFRLCLKTKSEIESLSEANWGDVNHDDLTRWATDYDAQNIHAPPLYDYLIYLRHHGFPSPFLDWSRSPYVAAFFAFENTTADRVAIFAYMETVGMGKSGSSRSPSILCPGPYVKTHSRHFLQQSQYTYCCQYSSGNWLFASHETALNHSPPDEAIQDVAWRYTLPSTERSKVLRTLDEHNLNAFSLFRDETSLLRTVYMRENEIQKRD